ncbi:uncharacterized protein LOC129322612 [Prosopis cineraria]|uniref:uncharacterized protein LOC129322612 n=1 Tax=Prosopis cineraria TaxID=364024 RepID=UPI0024109322|nr:uncharacterized protein LOC129322612 [Prosopis cineraria]
MSRAKNTDVEGLCVSSARSHKSSKPVLAVKEILEEETCTVLKHVMKVKRIEIESSPRNGRAVHSKQLYYWATNLPRLLVLLAASLLFVTFSRLVMQMAPRSKERGGSAYSRARGSRGASRGQDACRSR